MAMMEVTQASGSNAVGASASVTVDNEAVPGHSFLTTLYAVLNSRESGK